MANEWMVLGLLATTFGWSDALLASSLVAARVNVSSLMRGVGSTRASSSISATTVALLPVPGPARMTPCWPGL